MSTASRLAKLAEGLDSNGVLSADKGGTGSTTGGGTSSPTISTIAYVGNDTAADVAGGQTITLTGTNFAAGAKVLINTTQATVVTVVNSTEITFTAPALAAGSYILYVVNLNGSTAIAVPGIQYSGVPAWSTPAGTLGTTTETTAISATLSATSNSAVSYSLASGTLPVGATLNSNGTISGSSPLVAGSTTYTFTVRATDLENQDTDRQFSLTINPDVVTWSSPANGATLSGFPDTAYSSTLTATSAAGSSISYSANSLPPGLSISGSTITGTPTTAGTSTTTLTATATATSKTAQITINWTINIASDVYWKNTSLLLSSKNTTAPFNKDASANNFAVTINGDTKPNSFNPYTPGYYSNYFDGNGDYWTAASNTAFNFGTGDFTIECWVYPIANGLNYPTFLGSVTGWSAGASGHRFNNTGYANKFWFGLNGSGGVASGDPFMASTNTFSTNTWHHYSVTRSGNTWRMFVNGVLENTQTYAGSYDAGYGGLRSGWSTWDGAQGYFTGYTSNLRLVKGTAVYTTAFTPPIAPLTAISGTSLLTSQSNRFIDNSTNNFTITVNGNTSISSLDPFVPNPSYSTYGSAYFDGTGDYLSVSHNDAFDFGTGDFTVEFWLNRAWDTAAATRGILGKRASDSTSGWIIYVDSMTNNTKMNARLGSGGGNNFYTNSSPAIGIWEHWALVRTGTTLYWFKNGVIDNTGTSSINITDPSANFRVALADTWTAYASFSMADLRIVKGTAVYTTAFTPPTAPLTAIAGTSLLTLQKNQPVNNHTFLDSSTNNFAITRAGNATQGTFSPYGGNWSNYFDGTGDYLSFPNSAVFAFGTGSYTIEFWINGPLATDKFFLTGRAAIGTMHITTGGTGSPAGTLRYVGSSTIASSNVVMDNTWHHCAIVRNGSSNITLYVDGVSVGTGTDTTNYTNTTGTWYIASNDSGPPSNILTGYISNLRIVKGTALYTSNFTPPTTPLTAVSGTSLLTCQSNRLIDNSINNFTITKVGDSSVQRFSPFNPASITPTSYSGYFDGTDDRIQLPSSPNFTLVPTTPWTMEAWIYPTTNYTPVFWQNGGAQGTLITNTDRGRCLFGGTTGSGSGDGVIGGNSTVCPANQWSHVAITCDGNYNFYISINGVRGTAVNRSGENIAYSRIILGYVGAQPDLSSFFIGHISNARVVNGTEIYTGNFTPPTAPLTAVANTQLLTCQSPTFVDNSTNNFKLTVAGNTQPTQQNPFGFTSVLTYGYTPSTIGGSGYFDGTGDALSTPASATTNFGTSNFTIEAWVYLTAGGSFRRIYSLYGSAGATQVFLRIETANTIRFYTIPSVVDYTSSATVPINVWNHIAVVRNGSAFNTYLNGVSVASATSSSVMPTTTTLPSFISGYDANNEVWLGYISDARVVNGTALYTSNFVPPSAPLTAVQNTVLLTNMTSAGVYDAAMMNNMETVADAKLSTAITKFGSSSVYLDGTGDYLTMINSPQLNLGSANFTIEMWTYNTGNIGNLSLFYKAGSFELKLDSSRWVWQILPSNNIFVQNGTLTANTWVHVALVRNGDTTTLYINGTSYASGTSVNAVSNTNPLQIGFGTGGTFTGYIDDFRFTNGVARYTTNFTPPTAALLVK